MTPFVAVTSGESRILKRGGRVRGSLWADFQKPNSFTFLIFLIANVAANVACTYLFAILCQAPRQRRGRSPTEVRRLPESATGSHGRWQ